MMNAPIMNYRHLTCFKCGFEARTNHNKCSRCGRALHTRGEIRLHGFLLAMLGGILVVGMSAITLVVIGLVAQSGKPGMSARFTGTETEMLVMFGLFGAMLIFGFGALAAGFWQLIFARRNMFLLWAMIAMGFTLLMGGKVVLAIFGT
jgi:uncharacterized paraquat-inducible protein A